jgi:hypothetical protein
MPPLLGLSFLAGSLFHIFWQTLDQVIKADPKTPTMVIESHREKQGHDEETGQDLFVAGTNKHEPDEAGGENYEFRHQDITEYCSDKKTFLALEQRATTRAMMPNPKRSIHYRGLAAGGALQPQRTKQYCPDRALISIGF